MVGVPLDCVRSELPLGDNGSKGAALKALATTQLARLLLERPTN